MSATPDAAGSQDGAAAAPRSPALRTRGLTKRYGDLTAVRELDLEVREGEVFGLLGPNGAGKTTTILMLLGLTEPTAGEARVHGLDPLRSSLEIKRQVGYLPDNVGFYDGLSGRENLRYTAALNGIERSLADARIAELLERVGLSEAADRRVETYSRGMRQRLGIADVLVKRPRTAILDEPTVGIDPEGTREILQLIFGLSRNEGITVLLSSHLLYQVQEICDRVGIFVAGRMVAEGPVRELGERLIGQGPWVVEVGLRPADGAVAALEGIDGVERVESGPEFHLVSCRGDLRGDIARRFASAGSRWELTHLLLRGSALDEIYRRYFQEGVASDVDRRP